MIGQGHQLYFTVAWHWKMCFIVEEGPCLGSLVRWDGRVCSVIGEVGTLAGQSHRLCSKFGRAEADLKAAQGHYSCSLIMQSQRLCSRVRQGCWLGSVSK